MTTSAAMALEVQDLLWLLLPLAAASGWFAAHLDRRRKSLQKSSGLSPDYFRGINHLLNEQPDKAIEVFTQMLEVNSETVETHLALGSLFRRRGEVERAIRIHQNLMARPTLGKEQRLLALCELAQDYHRAGLLDRAENLFMELTEVTVHAEQALRSLMNIYEQEKDWEKAIGAGRRLLNKTPGKNLELVLAQYYCELGEDALQSGNAQRARNCALDALAIDPKCVRASMLVGHVAEIQGNRHDAIRAWQGVEQQDADYLDEVIDKISAAYRKQGEEVQLHAYLADVAQRRPGVRTLLKLADLIREREGESFAQVFIAERLRQQPSVPGLKKLIDLQAMPDASATRDNAGLIKDVLDQLAAEQEGYQCRQCGFRGQALHWQCPACHEWVTMHPATCSASLAVPANRAIPARTKPVATQESRR